jgi:small subunit ribosomal protein S27Ae
MAKKGDGPRNLAQTGRIYKIDGKRIERLRKECPKCGPGVYMAVHADRVSCGNCGYTEFKGD